MSELRARRLLVLLACAPLFVGLSNDIQEFDPTQYAEAGRSIAESGDWMHPRDNFGPYDDKPPMTFWLIALGIKLFGATSFAVRAPSLLAALAAAWATFAIGRELWSEATGLLAAALLLASPALQLMVADPKIDAGVTAFMAAAVFFFLLARRRQAFAWSGWLCVAGGLLTKGPIAVIAPLVALLPEALQDLEWRKRLRPLLGMLLVALLWLPYGLAHPARLTYFHLWEQSFGRLTGQSSWRNNTTPLFFFHTALWAFLPFSAALAKALWERLRAILQPDPARIPLFWLLIPLIGISASAYRLPQYLYWLAPPAALLAAQALEQTTSSRARRILAALQIAVTCAVPALIAFTLREWFPSSSAIGRFGWPLLAAALGAAGLLALRRLPFATGLAAAGVASLSAAALFFHAHLHPRALDWQPDHAFAELVLREDPAASVLPFAGAMPTNAAGFYARRAARPFEPTKLAQLVRMGLARVAVIEPSQLEALEKAGLRVETLLKKESFPTSRPVVSFLDQATRPTVVHHLLLVRLSIR